MTIRRRIALGYVLVLGLAVVGTTAGIVVGSRYQQRALSFRQTATSKRKLLTDLQVRILYNRPAKQLSPYLNDPEQFQIRSQNLLDRLAKIQDVLQDYQTLQVRNVSVPLEASAEDRQLNQRLREYEETVADFRSLTQAFVTDINQLGNTPADVAIAEQALLELVQSPEFVGFIEFPEQLVDFAEVVEQQEATTEVRLQQAEDLRTQIVVGSLALSVVIATIIAIYTTRAIAQPVQTITNLAHRVTAEDNFDLQATVSGGGEMEILANSLNQLIRKVKHLLTQLQQNNADLEVALEQLNRQQVQLVQSEKMSSLGELVAGVAHEINNPVNFIHGNLPHLQENIRDLSSPPEKTLASGDGMNQRTVNAV